MNTEQKPEQKPKQRKTQLPIAAIRNIFKRRAERRAKLKNKSQMRASKAAIQKMEKLIVAYIERLSESIMSTTENSGLNTVYERHIEFYSTTFNTTLG